MPKRSSTSSRIPSIEVQGDDSYIVIHRPTVAQARESQKVLNQVQQKIAREQRHLTLLMQSEDATDAAIEAANGRVVDAQTELNDVSYQELVKHILEWNWVDDEGQPLPQPHNNPSAMLLLTADEITWLSTKLQGTTDKKK